MTTADDTLALLAAANPVPQPPPVEPAERLRRLIEAEHRPIGQPAPARARRSRTRGNTARALAVAAAALAASFVGLVLSDGSSSPGVNIAAAAYAATAAGGGVVEAQFVERLRLPHGRVARYGHREWLDAAAGRRRDRRVVPARPAIRGVAFTRARPAASTIEEVASSARWLEVWNSGEAHVVRRIPYTFRRVPHALGHRLPGAPQPATGVGVAQPPAGIEAFRRLYREQPFRLIGRERWHGRWLWKLEGYVAFGIASSHARLTPLIAEVVLVDPRTYLPEVQRQVLLPSHGRRRQVESEDELVRYRRLPAGRRSAALLTVARQHPHAHVFVERSPKLGPAPEQRQAPKHRHAPTHTHAFVERSAKLGPAPEHRR